MNIQLIAKKHKSFTRTIRNKFVAKIGPRTNHYFVTQQVNRMVKLMDMWVRDRVEVGAADAFRKEQEETLKGIPRNREAVISDPMFEAINSRAINMLLLDRGIGLVYKLRDVTDGLRKQVRMILAQAKMLKDMSRLAQESAEQDRSAIIADITNFGRISSIPIEVYVEGLLRTKVSQLRTLARRNIWLRYGYHLVQIKNVRSEKPTPCHLYIGMVFALSRTAAKEYGVPHISTLPSGGTPLHPNCKHEEVLFTGKVPLVSPPDWAMNTKWNAVKKIYNKLGADDFVGAVNPNFRHAANPNKHKR
jgi:hypothetical protein